MKMINLLKFALIALVISISNYANAQSRNVDLKNFNNIEISSGIDLYLTQGSSESLIIKASEELLKNVVVEQSNGKIAIKYKDGESWGRMFRNESIKAYLTYKSLTNLYAHGGSDVFTQNTMKLNNLTLKASGGSDVKLDLNCKELTLTASGGSDVTLKGSAENMILTTSGGSDVDAFGFMVDYAKVTASGGSDANVYVNKGLEAGASGGSDVSYKGKAALKKTSNSKSGDVRHVN